MVFYKIIMLLSLLKEPIDTKNIFFCSKIVFLNMFYKDKKALRQNGWSNFLVFADDFPENENQNRVLSLHFVINIGTVGHLGPNIL